MKKKLLHHTFRVTRLMVLVAIAVAAITALGIQYRIYLANSYQQHVSLPPAPIHGKGDRVLVFAPHSDDETLGCGGMLATAFANGAKVRVVLVTNGDGFRFAVGRAYKTLRVTPAECITFACRRQRESTQAIMELGISPKHITFLGYPDRGIEPLWSRYWDSSRLFKSRATKSDHSPYMNSFTRRAPYCGESLLHDIQKVIRTENPTDIYVPHPCDNHPDHYATYCFVTAAVEQLRTGGQARRPQMHTYLVHRGEWPTPKGDHPNEALAPPYALACDVTHWKTLELAPDVAQAKREAIRDYRTQTAMEKGFLMSFARRNEIFGDVPVRSVARLERPIYINGNADDWPNVPPAVVDAVGDYVVAGLNKGGDVRTAYLANDGKNLYIRVDFVRHISKRIRYNINLRGLGDGDKSSRYAISVKLGSRATPAGTLWAARDNILEVAVPLRKFRPDRDLFVQVQTKVLKLTVDNTGWQVVRFRNPPKTRYSQGM